jgi:hypothetical protein
MLRENRNGQFRDEMSQRLVFSKKLQALTDENLYLERHLAAMVLDNRMLQSLRSRSKASNFKMVQN